MLYRSILKATKFQLLHPKRLSTVVKNILGGHHAPPPPPSQIRLQNCPKSKMPMELEKLDIDWYIAMKPSVRCSGWKRTSIRMPVDSIQHQPPQLTLKLSPVRLSPFSWAMEENSHLNWHCSTYETIIINYRENNQNKRPHWQVIACPYEIWTKTLKL